MTAIKLQSYLWNNYTMPGIERWPKDYSRPQGKEAGFEEHGGHFRDSMVLLRTGEHRMQLERMRVPGNPDLFWDLKDRQAHLLWEFRIETKFWLILDLFIPPNIC